MTLFQEMLAVIYASIEREELSLCTPDTCPVDGPITGDPVEHAGHVCPTCGHEQYLCREGDSHSRHSHVCPKCGAKWQHEPEPAFVTPW